MKIQLTVLLGTLLILPAHAARLDVTIEIPRISTAEYHRPYVAVWVEGADQKALANLAVWYMMKNTKEGHGTKWLPDLRQWWRKSGRTLQVPVDGLTSPTRPAGTHALALDGAHPELAALAPGQYTLVVEAVREVGGRELIKVPFQWGKASTDNARGSTELGAISVTSVP